MVRKGGQFGIWCFAPSALQARPRTVVSTWARACDPDKQILNSDRVANNFMSMPLENRSGRIAEKHYVTLKFLPAIEAVTVE